MSLILTIELIPASSWYDNIRKIFPKSGWDKIRKYVYAEYNNQCGICKSQERLHCHEVWDYDDEKHIQKLKGFIALCQLCHHVKHIGFAGIEASKGKLDIEKVIQHFMKVNNCDRITFDKHYKEAFEKWEERSHYDWDLDISEDSFTTIK